MAINTRKNVLTDVFPHENKADFTHAVKITVPGTTSANVPLSADTKRFFDTFVSKQFSTIFGGATAVSGQGSWLDDNGVLITENVTVVSSYTRLDNTPETLEKLLAVRNLARVLCDILTQQCVLVTVEPITAAYFI